MMAAEVLGQVHLERWEVEATAWRTQAAVVVRRLVIPLLEMGVRRRRSRRRCRG